MKLYMFRTVPLVHHQEFISLYTQQCYMSYRIVDILRAGSVWNSGQLAKDQGGNCMTYTYTIAVCTVKNS